MALTPTAPTLAEGSTEITDTIKQKCSDKYCAGAEQLGWKGTNPPSRNHFVRNRRQEGNTEKEIAKFQKMSSSCPTGVQHLDASNPADAVLLRMPDAESEWNVGKEND